MEGAAFHLKEDPTLMEAGVLHLERGVFSFEDVVFTYREVFSISKEVFFALRSTENYLQHCHNRVCCKSARAIGCYIRSAVD